MSGPAYARVLASEGGVSARERLRPYLTGSDLSAALAATDCAAIVLDLSAAEKARPEIEHATLALRAAGAFAHVASARMVVGASSLTLRRAIEIAGADEPTRAILRLLEAAFLNDRERPTRLRLRDITLDLSERAQIMGILNVTPDSFYDRGKYRGVDVARARAAEMAELGATVIDVGGQSYAHWNPQIAADEERERVVPVVEALVRDGLGVAISIDTFKSTVAEAALAAGAHAINDCSGLSDPRLASVTARYDAGLVVMHLKGRLNVREPVYHYEDAMAEICAFLGERIDAALADGIAHDALAIDPGLEFGKEPETDLEILERFGDLRSLGYPILFAASRKSFIGRVFHRPANELLVPSLATAAVGISAGAALVRVHDVEETAQLARMLGALRGPNRARLALAAEMPGT